MLEAADEDGGAVNAVATAAARGPIRCLHLNPRVPRFESLVSLVALAVAVAAGERDAARLAILGLACLAACVGAAALGRARAPGASALRAPAGAAGGAVVPAAVTAATAVLGVRAGLCLLAVAVAHGLAHTGLGRLTPFAILFAGAAGALAALAGWQTAASAVDPTPFLVAALVFLWVPGHLWMRSIAPAATDRPPPGAAALAALAGPERTAAAIFAASIGLVLASLVLAPRLGWQYAATAVPAGACLLAAAHALRRRAGPGTAARACVVSTAYLLALLAGLVLSTP